MNFRTLEVVKLQINSNLVRSETYQSESYLVAPAVLLVEGVHNGSSGPLLYTQDELSKFAVAWNGRPLPIDHPKAEDGTPLSCNSPQILNDYNVGQVFNAQYIGNSIKAELWVSESLCGEKAPSILNVLKGIKAGIIELSTGLFSDVDETPGTWQGKEYVAVVKNIRPDHVALLPNNTGACSVQDGCGFPRTNEFGKKLPACKMHLTTVVVGNGVSHEEIRMSLQREVDKLDNPTAIHFVVAVYDGFMIYRKESNQEGMPSKLYRQEYSVTVDGEVTLAEEVVEVREQTDYISVNEEGDTNNNKGKEEGTMMKKCCPEKVKALIEHKDSPFGEDQKEWLEGLTEEEFTVLEAPYVVEKEGTDDGAGIAGGDSAADSGNDGLKDGEDKPRDSEDTSPKKPATAKEYIESEDIPEEVRDVLNEGLKAHEAEKKSLIKALVDKDDCPFTSEELNAKKVDELRNLVKLAGLAKPRSSYALAAGVHNTQPDPEPENNEDAPPRAPQLFGNKKEVAGNEK